MGMYTEFFFRAQLRRSTPPRLLDWFEHLAVGRQVDAFDDHPFFGQPSWLAALTCQNSVEFTFADRPLSFTRNVPFIDRASLVVHSSFKSSSEVQMFVHWISQFVDAEPRDFLGYWLNDVWREDGQPPLLIYMPHDR